MSRVKLFLDVIADVRSLADSLEAVADAMMESEPEPKEEKPMKKAAPKKTPKPDAKRDTKPKEEEPLTLEDVRAVLADKSRKGYTAEVKLLLIKHGADKLSEIDPAEYAALLAAAEVL